MDNRTRGPLTDEALEREIERACAVQPSPEYVARVRARMAREAAPAVPWWQGRRIVAAAAVAVGAAAVVAASMFSLAPSASPERSGAVPNRDAIAREVPRAPDVTHADPASSGVEVDQTADAPLRRRAPDQSTPLAGGPGLPEVLVSAGELAALRFFIEQIEQGRFTAALLPGSMDSGALQLSSLDIQPIVVEPIEPIAFLQGDLP